MSPFHSSAQASCLKFRYFAQGDGHKELQTFSITRVDDDKNETLWFIRGIVSTNWLNKKVTTIGQIIFHSQNIL